MPTSSLRFSTRAAFALLLIGLLASSVGASAGARRGAGASAGASREPAGTQLTSEAVAPETGAREAGANEAAAIEVSAAAASSEAEPGSSEDRTGAPAIEERLEVRGRLGAEGPQLEPGRTVSLERVDGEALRDSGARSLPEYLARLPGLTAVDETGNGRQLSIDLRGFAATPGATALFVDGVRLDDPDTGAAPFELVRPIDVESIDIRKGALGPLFGGGSLAGGVEVSLRPARRTPAFDLRGSLGSAGLSGLELFATGPVGALAIAGSAAHQAADAPRRSASMRESSARLQLRRETRAADLVLELSGLDAAWDQPGALTKAELEADRRASVWNLLDRTEAESAQVRLGLEREGRGATDLRVGLALRRLASETLTTGRSGYGFLTRADTRSLQLRAEGLTRPPVLPRCSLRWGFEARSDRLEPEGWATSAIHSGGYDFAVLTSETSVHWERLAAFAGAIARLPRGWTLEAGLRHDWSRVERSGFELDLPPEQTTGRRAFADTSLGVGLAHRHEGRRWVSELRASWSQSFLAPSSMQLFAFPGFFGNAALEPQRAAGLVVGGSLAGRRYSVDLELYRTRVREEIVFDEQARRNLNAGGTRRQGAELRLNISPHRRLELLLGQAYTEAGFLEPWESSSGRVPRGSEVPLVAPLKSLVRLDWRPSEAWMLALWWRRVSSSVASNDFDNSSGRLPGHDLVGIEAHRRLALRRGELTLALAVENLLDELALTRGIEVGGELYFTPAPPRSLGLRMDYRF